MKPDCPHCQAPGKHVEAIGSGTDGTCTFDVYLCRVCAKTFKLTGRG